MFIINKIRILSAVILAICSAAACLSSCTKDESQLVPDETVIGSQGEILGVSYYTVENESDTQTVLFEITTKKPTKTKNDKTIKNNNSDKISEAYSSEKEITSSVKPNTETQDSINETDTVSPSKTDADSSAASKNNKTTKPKHVPVSYVKRTEKETKRNKTPSTVRATKQSTKPDSNGTNGETIPEIAEGINTVFITDTVAKGDDASIMIQGEPGKKYLMTFYYGNSDSVFTEPVEQTADGNGFVTWTFRVPSNCISGNRKIIINEVDSSDYIQTSIKVK